MDEKERKIEELESEISQTIESQMQENQQLRDQRGQSEREIKGYREFEEELKQYYGKYISKISCDGGPLHMVKRIMNENLTLREGFNNKEHSIMVLEQNFDLKLQQDAQNLHSKYQSDLDTLRAQHD